jgi:DNA-binding NarL/FixJ family response regulator
MTKAITIVLADDHILLRSGLRLLLDREPSFEVVGEASDGEELLQLLDAVQPDIVILDLSMPKIDGIECLKEIISRGYKTKIIVLTMYDDEHYIKEVMRCGAMGYVQKGSVDTELFLAIREVSRGRIYLNAKDSQNLLSTLVSESWHKPEPDDPYLVLSAREREVLKLLSRGYSLKEAADSLYLSIKTVDTYKTRIMEKLNFTKKSELVSYALKHGLLTDKETKDSL